MDSVGVPMVAVLRANIQPDVPLAGLCISIRAHDECGRDNAQCCPYTRLAPPAQNIRDQRFVEQGNECYEAI